MTIYSLDVLLSQFGTSLVPCPVLTVTSWPAYRFFRRQVRGVWYSHLLKNFPHFIVIHAVKDFDVVHKAEVDVFLELSCFFDDPRDVGHMISGSSAFLNPAWTSGVVSMPAFWFLMIPLELSRCLWMCQLAIVLQYSSVTIVMCYNTHVLHWVYTKDQKLVKLPCLPSCTHSFGSNQFKFGPRAMILFQ